jgi:hypothetical protein
METILGLTSVLRMLEVMESLSKFAQSQEWFIFNFVNVIKICQADLYAMYCDTANKYGYHWFFQFCNLIDNVNHAIFII